MFKNLASLTLINLFSLLSFSVFAENTTFTTSHFSGSGNCTQCHDGLTDTSGEDVSIVEDWSASMMANSTKDPLWRAKVATELERNPHLSTVIKDKCTKCHAPMANYELTKVQGNNIELFGPNGILTPGHALHDAGMNGVSCTVCHQIADDATMGRLDGFSGQYKINQTKTIYGPYSDVFGQPMVQSTGYTPAYSAHVSDSALCASCHNLKTPFVDNNGKVLTTSPESEFPEQMPYTEWQHSIFDDAGSNPQSCQDCHMPKTTAKVSSRPRWLAARDGFAKHHLVGANTTMLTMLRDNAAQLDVTSANLDEGIDRAREMLQSAANIEVVSAVVTEGVLEARVRVQNNSGHKAPTAYPSRRMWIHFKLTDSANNIVFESGRINADGSIVGADNDGDQTIFEPHYDLITSADQVQIYEAVMGDSAGNITYTLLRGAQYLKDNRLTPQGFDKYAVPYDVAVHGQAANDSNFNLGVDELVYRIPVSVAGELNIGVSLNYQTIAHGFVQDLYKEGHLEQVQTFKAMYDAQSLKHETVANANTTVDSVGRETTVSVPTLILTTTASTIDEGQSTTLEWVSTETTSCSAGWTSSQATSGAVLLNPSATTTYSMTCSGDFGNVTESVTVAVDALPVTATPTITIASSPTRLTRGGIITLNWSSTDANTCIASGDWSGTKAVNGSESVVVDGPATFTLACDGAVDSISYRTWGRRFLTQI